MAPRNRKTWIYFGVLLSLLVLCAANTYRVLGAHPTTRPTTQPATQPSASGIDYNVHWTITSEMYARSERLVQEELARKKLAEASATTATTRPTQPPKEEVIKLDELSPARRMPTTQPVPATTQPTTKPVDLEQAKQSSARESQRSSQEKGFN